MCAQFIVDEFRCTYQVVASAILIQNVILMDFFLAAHSRPVKTIDFWNLAMSTLKFKVNT